MCTMCTVLMSGGVNTRGRIRQLVQHCTHNEGAKKRSSFDGVCLLVSIEHRRTRHVTLIFRRVRAPRERGSRTKIEYQENKLYFVSSEAHVCVCDLQRIHDHMHVWQCLRVAWSGCKYYHSKCCTTASQRHRSAA